MRRMFAGQRWAIGCAPHRRIPVVTLLAGEARPASADLFAPRLVPARIAEASPFRQGWCPSQDGIWQSVWRLRSNSRQTPLSQAVAAVARVRDPPRNCRQSRSALAVGWLSGAVLPNRRARRRQARGCPPRLRRPPGYGRTADHSPAPDNLAEATL